MPESSESSSRYPLILNPKAKSERGHLALKFIEAHAERFLIHRTQSRGEAIELVKKYASEKADVVIAAGGDGTLNAAIEGLAGTSTTLGVFPTGTMNVFAREMGIPFDRLERAMTVIDADNRKKVDLFEMNGAPFVQMAGIGFDAEVIEATTWESKKRFGPLAYLLSGARVLGRKLPMMTITTKEGQSFSGMCLLVGNGSLYGGHFPLFRAAENTDGLLDVVLFREAGYRFVRDSLRGLATGGFDPISPGQSVAYLKTAGFKVTSDEAVPVEVDGELWGRAKEVEFAFSGKSLSVLAPIDPEPSHWLNLLGRINPFHGG
ncbi:diacylglycerol kinase family lipid kinase [Akkermansiaceae bacterium]|nr:diacylglycerol kinase family lipid kinase [Akkermansiaceae bacterium]